MALTRIPILILYGDNIPEQAVDLPAQDSWRARLKWPGSGVTRSIDMAVMCD
jgi:hypothetical protein